MRHFRLPNKDVKSLSTFKKQIGSILKKIDKFDEPEKNEAITYLRKCIEAEPGTSSQGNRSSENKRNTLKRKCKLNNSKHYKKLKDCSTPGGSNDKKVRKKIKYRKTNKPTVKPFLLKCRVCDATKNTKLKLLKHLETLHFGTPISCLKCRRTFNSNVAFDWHVLHLCHIKKASTNRKYKCNECSKEFRFKRHYTAHVEGHKRNNCTYCNMVLTHRKELVRHMQEVHSIKLETAVHECQFCEKRYAKKRSLYNHLQQHYGNQHVCTECGQVFNSYEDYYSHSMKHKQLKPYKCTKCSEHFSRRQQYLSHMMRHDRYKCITCNEGYASKANAIRHKQKGHLVDGLHPRMVCPYCPEAFHRKLSLHKHLRKHTDVRPTINCKYCDKTFQSPYRYYKHCMTILHEKQSPETNQLVCESCGKQFMKKYLLEQHLFRVHKGEKELKGCQYCDYKTANKTNLERHVALHLNQGSQYICDQCGKSYSSIGSLKDHLSYMHIQDKEFKCEECGKIFKRNSDLVRHVATHSENRPYKCNTCGKTYKRSTHLKRHIERTHNTLVKTRKVQRLQPNEKGDLVPIPEKIKPKFLLSNAIDNGGIDAATLSSVLNAVEGASGQNDNSEYVYFDVIDNIDL